MLEFLLKGLSLRFFSPEGSEGTSMEQLPPEQPTGSVESKDGSPTKDLEPPKRTVLVFGQGPVITEPSERVNYWSQDLAKAASVLKRFDRSIDHFVVMGGKTGGADHPSEAELIALEMEKNGVEQNDIDLEKESKDTIENIVNFLNLNDQKDPDISKPFDILCSPYHTPRTQILMQLFCVPVDKVFQSTELLRFNARSPQPDTNLTTDSAQWSQQELQRIDQEVNLNDPATFSSQQSDPSEQRDVKDRYIKDDLWTRELLEYPEKWLPYVGRLDNVERVRAILNQVDHLYPTILKEKYGISIDNFMSPEQLTIIKNKLQQIPSYQGLSKETVNSWVQENTSGGWPKETEAKLEMLLHARGATT